MSAAVKLSSAMPGDDATNGVDALAGQMVREVEEGDKALRCCVVWIDVSKVTVDADTGDHVPTIRVRRIEPIGLVSDVDPGIQRAVETAVEKRTGRTALSFGTVEVSDDGAYSDPDQMTIDEDDEQ